MRDATAEDTTRDADPLLQRATGDGRVAFRLRDGATALADLYQSGAAKIRLPRHAEAPGREAVLINTAGGLTGGDRLSFAVEAGAGTRVTAVTQASEKVYRALGGVAEIATTLTVGDGARLDWLPQDTILFDRSALSRTLTVDMAENASLVALESVIFGRAAMAEAVASGQFRESWRIRRGGRLVFADETRIGGPVADILARAAVSGGRRAVATVVAVRPDAEALIDPVRAALPEEAGASAWNGLLTARIAAPDSRLLRQSLGRVLAVLRDGAPLPRVWTC
ncbi:MAG: urease accessory protein UreD [Rhodobiaceae bacterium]|nr:urease accessory protein UreD [Rhodobiaceae bacterium]